ncbi:LOW QUALITY PROTEIN: uncharacterized protein At2g29880-like [Setaria italica]|uniref:LOW QUALITY PROTEIN: uncharacterized protein At2g29880-like n=1 Tax=Setaria italica TaxID=4555 RepID=UPI000BE5DBE9|nr:LOW QUALITY PROTEIN: uncharacterized protein At2g29880-like [Setaria italica]
MTNPQQPSASGQRKISPSHPPRSPPPPPSEDFGIPEFGVDEEISKGSAYIFLYVILELKTCTSEPMLGTTKNTARANWNHQMKLFLIGLLRQYDLPRFRTQNACSKEAWTTMVAQVNSKFTLSFTVAQVKQKEQDLKKEYRVVKDLSDESGFGWDSNRKMVTALDSVWKSLAQRRNKDALSRWRDKSFPYYDDLYALYDGRYAEGRSCHGMDHYANKAKKSSEVPASHSPQLHVTEGPLQSTLPTQSATGAYAAEFSNKESSVPEQFQETQCQTSCPSSSTPEAISAKRERYLMLKKEEIDRFAAIEEKKMEDPYSINKCVVVLEGLLNLQMEEMIKAADIFRDNSANRETFLSFSRDETRLGWLRKQIELT